MINTTRTDVEKRIERILREGITLHGAMNNYKYRNGKVYCEMEISVANTATVNIVMEKKAETARSIHFRVTDVQQILKGGNQSIENSDLLGKEVIFQKHLDISTAIGTSGRLYTP